MTSNLFLLPPDFLAQTPTITAGVFLIEKYFLSVKRILCAGQDSNLRSP